MIISHPDMKLPRKIKVALKAESRAKLWKESRRNMRFLRRFTRYCIQFTKQQARG